MFPAISISSLTMIGEMSCFFKFIKHVAHYLWLEAGVADKNFYIMHCCLRGNHGMEEDLVLLNSK